MIATGGPGSRISCALASVLAAMLAVGVSLTVLAKREAPPAGAQQPYVEEIQLARKELFQGQLVYTDARSLELVAGAEPSPFQVQVLGSWRSAGPGEAESPVSAGGQIGVKLHCSGAGVRCEALSSERQNVLSKSDSATWMWDVGAARAGKVSIALTVTAYLGDSDTVLIEKPPVTARVEVAPPPGDTGWTSRAKDAWHWVTGTATSLGGLAMSVSAITALVVMVVRRRAPAADTDTDTDTEDRTRDAVRDEPRG
ncbi:hypothetical protein [Streptomyces sp. NPDC006012]|uniref:hypothetical protein n=1 Tax=Streptomyces sp. NPDC006012 TaxID=3364739 RepID=UPI00367ADD11